MNKVQILEEKIRRIKEEIDEIQDKCKHEYVPYTLKSGEKLAHKPCPKCNKYFDGWWCPKSKDTFCDYNHDDGHYDSDDCKYCHQPDERK